MPAAIGSTSRQDKGAAWIDLRDKGGRPGGSPAFNQVALQAASDALTSGGTIYLPPSPNVYGTAGPVRLGPSVQVVTDAPGAATLQMSSNSSSNFLLGIPVNPVGQTLDSTHFVDLYGKLDTSAASAAGQRYGIRTRQDSQICQGEGPFNYAGVSKGDDYWRGVSGFTIDFAFEYSAGVYRNIAYFGMSNGGNPDPWFLAGMSGKFQFLFGVSDGTWMGRRVLVASFAPPVGAGTHRGTIQVDFATPSVVVIVDGTQVALIDSPNPTYFVAGCRLQANSNYPFKVGSLAGGGNTYGSETYSLDANLDLILYGLKVTRGLVYANDGVGQPARRIDAAAITDLNRYFQLTSATIACFPFTDLPASVMATRFLTVKSVNQFATITTTALFCSSNHGNPFSAISNNSFINVDVKGAGDEYGSPLLLGYALYLHASGCEFSGGAHGIGSWVWGANYKHTVKECSIGGSDAGIFSHYGDMQLSDIFFLRNARALVWGNITGIDMDRVLGSSDGDPECILRLHQCESRFRRLSVDIESNPPAMNCYVYADAGNAAGNVLSARLSMRDIGVGVIKEGTPFAILEDSTASALPLQSSFNVATAEFDNITMLGANYSGLVQVNGSAWRGTVRTAISPYYPPIVNVQGVGNVVSHHDTFTAPPRRAKWFRGSSILHVNCPADGQYSSFRPIRTGEYNTPLPPLWQGYDPFDAGVNGLAAYPRSHSYWTAGGTTIRGMWNDAILFEANQRIFTGAAATASAGIEVGLSTAYANNGGGIAEPSGNGYARVSVSLASWTTSSNGEAHNLASVVFPVATGSGWGTIRSAFLRDTGTGRVICAIDIAAVTIAAGPSKTFAIGELSIAWTDPLVGYSPGWRAAIANAYLKGTALPTPSLYLALSTAAADATSGPTEPAGGSYARVAAVGASWKVGANQQEYVRGNIANVAALAFPAPTGSWGTARSVYLMDASSGGNVVAAADLTIPRTLTTGSTAPAFAVGALWSTVG